MTSVELPGGRSAAHPASRLSVSGLSKTFGNARVLRDIELEVLPGEIHGLIGQNGSGKSTLAKILTGLYTPDAGASVAVDGAKLRLPVRPLESRDRGVAVVHQSLGLVRDASVVENMRIGRLRGSKLARRIDWRQERAAADAIFERLGRRVPLDAPVQSLREDERATVAIARALQDVHPGAGLIIFDESTRSLGRPSLEHFFTIVDEIVTTGTSVLLITHRLEEIIGAADRVTVLRDGVAVERGRPVTGMSEADLAALMLGRDLVGEVEQVRGGALQQASPAATKEPIRIQGLTGLRVKDIGIDIAPGEIVGVTGLGGSGYDDVPYLVAGASPAVTGTVQLPEGPVELPGLTPPAAIRAGIALVPEGREYAGLAMGLSAAENISLPRSARGGRALRPLDGGGERSVVDDWMRRLDVQPRRPQMAIKNFSGGNQQKALLAKWLANAPALLLLHEPTQAVDVGARETIVHAVRRAAAEGCAVLVAGSDENELSLLCDRILVFQGGAVHQVLPGRSSPDDIVTAIYSGGSRGTLRPRSAGHLNTTEPLNTTETEEGTTSP